MKRFVNKVWIAKSTFDYEGTYILGVFSNRQKAIRACTDDADKDLTFKQLEGYETYVCNITDYHRYVVYEAQVDEGE